MKASLIKLIFALLIASNVVYGSSKSAVFSKFISNEYQGINGTITAEIKCKFNNDITFSSQPVFSLPTGWSYTLINNPSGMSFNSGDSTIITVQFSYNTSNLPFFPQTLKYKQEITNSNNTTIKEFANAEAKVYFTSYNSVEIWNISDFFNIHRKWLNSKSNIDTTRIMLLKSTLPQSNLSLDDEVTEEWQEDWTFKKVQGLAYLIPMKAVKPDSIIWFSNNVGDGDSTDMSKSNYSGTFTGRLVNTSYNDLNQTQTIGLGGIRVKLLEQDFWGNETFAEGYTDDNGYFSLTYSKWQTFEGGDIELYLQFKSKSIVDGQYSIIAKQEDILHNAYVTEYYLGKYSKNYHYTNLGNYFPDHDAFRSVHWVRNGMKYFRNSFSPQVFKIDIKLFRDDVGTHFAADGLFGISLPLDDPTIFLENSDGDNENDIYHEFGHYMMWELQNRNYIIPYEDEDFVDNHSWSEQNGPRFAWSEGWAAFIQAVLDAAYRLQDSEYAHDENGGMPLIEKRANYNLITNGLRSEYYIGCALYDMWDGADKGLPVAMPVATGETAIHGYNDSYTDGWNDNVSFSFYQMIQPLINHGGSSGKIQNIYEYFSYFINEQVGENTTQRRQVSDCFRNNRVVFDISRYNNKFGNNCMSSDNLAFTKTEYYTGTLPGIFTTPININDSYFINLSGSTINNNQTETKDYFFGAGVKRYIIEDLWLGDNNSSSNRTASLNINPRILNSGETYYPNDASGTLYTNNGTDILLRKGSITLGGSSTSAHLDISNNSFLQINPNCNLIVNNNSMLVIKKGGSLHIKTGANVKVSGSGKIKVETGGYLCIEPGINFTDKDLSSSIVLDPGFNIGVNPIKEVYGNCMNFICGEFEMQSPVLYINDLFEIEDSQDNSFNNDIEINDGGILKLINSQLKFIETAKIVIHYGGKIEIINSNLTNVSNCNDLWQGIIAEPGSTIELKNGATIENAILAIDAQGDATVKAFNSNFTNNITAIKIKSLNDGTISTYNYIRKCNFTTTDFLSTIGEHPEQFIKLYGLKNINIQGNTFKNLNPDDYSISERGIGIYANYSAMNITPYCPTITQIGQTCDNEIASIFENLHYGIYIDSYSDLKKVTIDRNQFTNNTRGIYVFGSYNTSITRNNFSIGEPLVNEIISSDLLTGYYTTDMIAYGVYLSYSKGYKIEENNFTTIYEKPGKVGLGVYQSGKSPNQIYKNDFNSLRYALLANGENGSSSTNPTIGSSGLQLRCNSNDKNTFDLISMNQGAVASYQGYYNNPTGNTFTPMSCSSGGKNIYGYINSYNYYSGNSTMIPTCKSTTVWAYQSSIPFSTMDEVCPSSFSTGKGITTILTEFKNMTINEQQVANQFSTLVDANNTDWFLKKISQNHNPSNMKKKLLEASPWLSDTVMVSLIKNDNYFAATDLAEVLVSNPQSATSPAVQESLDSMTTPLPYTLRMQINSLDTVLSPKTAMEAQLASLLNEKEYYANEIINYYLSDTLPGAKDSLIIFLASQNTLNFDYKLFSYYYTLGQTADARNLLTLLPSKYSLSGGELTYYNKFNALYNILLELKENNLNTDNLNIAQIQTLRTLAQDTVILPGSMAKRIICKIDSVPYNEWIRLPYETTTPANPLMGYVYESAECGSNPYPNCTLVIINENSDTLLVTPAITDNYGFFKFNDSEIASLNPDDVVTITTKNGYRLQSPEYKIIAEWKNESPVNLTLANSNLEWSDLYSTVDSLYNGGTVLDLNGNLYVAGYTNTPLNYNDFLIIKYSPTGERLWVNTYNGSANFVDRAVDIAVDNENNCYVLGNSAGTGTLQDIVLIKYNSDGTKQWEKRINGTANNYEDAKSIVIDATNNVYITGTTTNIATGSDIVTIKYSKTGQLKWQKQYATTANEYATKIKLDNTGNVIIAGYGDDYITIKYNTNGTQLWLKQFNNGNIEIARDMTIDNNNNIIVTGTGSNYDVLTIKYSTSGVQQWLAQTSGNVSAIATDNIGNIYICGTVNTDAFTLKYDPSGVQQWKKIYTTSYYNGVELFQAIAIDNNNDVYVTGFSATETFAKYFDMLTIKYDSESNEKWRDIQSGGYRTQNRGNDIVVSENNNVYITGVINENSLYKMATLKYSQCPSTATLKSATVTTNNQELEDVEDDELIQVINFQENKVIVYPNPYTESTRIELITKTDAQVSLEVFSMGGKLIENIFTGFSKQGKYNYTFSAKKQGYSAGTYVLKMTIGNEINSYWLVEMK